MTVNNPTMKLAEAIISSTPNTTAFAAAQRGIIDYLAAAFQSRYESEAKDLLHLIKLEGGHANHLLIGQDCAGTSAQSALFNGFVCHLLDYDDVHAEVRGHPSSVIVSALFAAATEHTSGSRFLSAYIVGVELMARLGQALHPYHYLKGWHNTGTLGVIAAAGAISYLWEMDSLSAARILSMAATQASGLRLQFGTPIKPLHAGIAARNAIYSAQWVQAGLSSHSDFLQDDIGFLSIYGSGDVKGVKGQNGKQQQLFLDWGEPWRIVTPGLWFKKYPFCSAACHGAEAASKLYDQYKLTPEQIVNVTVIFPSGGDAALIYSKPQTGEQGRFSIEYVVWLALTGQRLDFFSFRAEPITATLQEQLGRVKRVYDDQIQPSPDAMPQGRFTIVEVELVDGGKLRCRVDVPEGSPGAPFDNQQLADKLNMAVGSSLDGDNIMKYVMNLRNNTLEDLLHAIAIIR